MAATGKIGGQESGDAGLGHILPGQPRAERHDIGIVMLARKRCRERLGNQGATERGVTVDRNRNPDARSAQGDAALGSAGGHGIGQLEAEIGVIDACVTIGAKIEDLMPLFGEPRGKDGLKREGGMIGGNGDAQGGRAPIRVKRNGVPLAKHARDCHTQAHTQATESNADIAVARAPS
jgi:hypothetical protein